MIATWTNILDGQRLKCSEILLNIVAGGLDAEFYNSLRSEHDGENGTVFESATLANGAAGWALFYAYKYLRDGDSTALERCNEAIISSAKSLSSNVYTASLYGGVAGIAWVIEHCLTILGKHHITRYTELNRLTDEIDTYLLEWVGNHGIDRPYDLIDGIVGIGAYFYTRLPRKVANVGLREIAHELVSKVENSKDGLCWVTPQSLIPGEDSHNYPNGYYNLGMAHGIPGVIALLSHLYAAGLMQTEVEKLLRGSTRWLFRQANFAKHASTFTYASGIDVERIQSRLAWCYGDAGVAAAVFSAAVVLNDLKIKSFAVDIALKGAGRAVSNSGVIDASFCHGAFGLVHLFNRFYQATRDPAFLNASLTWFDKGWNMRTTSSSSDTYLFYQPDLNGNLCWRPELGLLNGLAGIGMATLAAVGNQAPTWDEMFLSDLVG